jgi:tetraacyldisaccharide 4'-kinase
VLDDGFQHRALGRSLDVVLLAVDDVFPGRVLPRGPYREPPSALARADAVLVTRRAGDVDDARRVAALVEERYPGLVKGAVHLAGGGFASWDGEPVPPPSSNVLAVAGVARPEAFRASVRGVVSGAVELLAFGDHHDYSRTDATRIRRQAGSRALVTTEKDAVKLIAHRDILGPALILRQRLIWDWGEDSMLRLVEAAVLGAGTT